MGVLAEYWTGLEWSGHPLGYYDYWSIWGGNKGQTKEQ